MMLHLEEIQSQAHQAAVELLEAAQAVFEGIYPLVQDKQLFLAAQCEHLNRALIIESD